MAEYKERRRYPTIFPLVEDAERVLENLEALPHWFIDDDDFVYEPQTTSGAGEGGRRKPPTDRAFGEPAGLVPLDRQFGPAAGYRSFRYFDASRQADRPITGLPIRNSANVWGVMIPMNVCKNLARALHLIRDGMTPATLSAEDTQEARDLLYQYFLVHFLVDRACEIIENVLLAATGSNYELFLTNNLVPGKSSSPATIEKLGILSRHRMFHHAVTRNNAHRRLLVQTPTQRVNMWKGASVGTFAEPILPHGSIGATYSQLLSNLFILATKPKMLPHDGDAERMLGLNFLIGADIPAMEKPDLFYKFSNSSSPVQLPVHVW